MRDLMLALFAEVLVLATEADSEVNVQKETQKKLFDVEKDLLHTMNLKWKEN
jgi:hypothetical protein